MGVFCILLPLGYLTLGILCQLGSITSERANAYWGCPPKLKHCSATWTVKCYLAYGLVLLLSELAAPWLASICKLESNRCFISFLVEECF